jgi:hypothetical protein
MYRKNLNWLPVCQIRQLATTKSSAITSAALGISIVENHITLDRIDGDSVDSFFH